MADLQSILEIGVGMASAVAAAALYYVTSGQKPLDAGVDLNNQTVILEDVSDRSFSLVPSAVWAIFRSNQCSTTGSTKAVDGSRISALAAELNDGKPIETIYDDVRTLYDVFQRGLRVSRNQRCLGARTGPNREYVWQTYQQVYDRARAFGSGLVHLGLQTNTDSFVGIYCKNCPEWVICDEAAIMFSMVTIPLYETFGVESCQYIINLASIKVVVCDSQAKLKTLMEMTSQLPSLKTVIVVETVDHDVKQKASSMLLRIVSFEEIEELGAKHLVEPVPPKSSDLATICFTSGTTGTPKGVMLTHGNVVADLSALMLHVKKNFQFAAHNCHLSYLPLPHMFERAVQATLFANGCSVGFYSGQVSLLFEDLQMLKPTFFITVPRLVNRIRDKVYNAVAESKLKSMLLNLAIRQKTAYVTSGIVTKDTLWDKLVFRKIQNLLGGNVNFIIVGSAPISMETMNFFRCVTGCIVIDGYGQTEATAAIASPIPGDGTSEHVGCPWPCNSVKLVDVPEMDYFSENGQGEICAKGTNVFLGYYKEAEKTAETLDQDGWLHTGDIGVWLPNGTLKVVDRKKNIFKLSQGEYIAPERIEQIYLKGKFVSQVFVDGNSTESHIMGVVVPDSEGIEPWAMRHGVSTDLKTLCDSKEVKDAILNELRQEGYKAGLKGFEQVKDILLWSEPFSVDNGLLTPTLKSKRPQLRKKFSAYIEHLYKINNI